MADRAPAPAGSRWRAFGLVAGGGVACSALAAIAGARPWVQVPSAAGSFGVPALSHTLDPYAQSAPALALALVTLASWGVLLVLRGRARTVMAVLGLLFAAGLLVLTVLGYTQVPAAVRQAVADQFGVPRQRAANLPMHHTAWYWLALVSAAGCVVTLAVAARRAHTWPAMGTKYDAPTGPTPPRGEQDMWRTLDEGRDPTDPGSA
ncbi:MAG TPA: Trp biosynthesis-associated membrane protein [Marmoricola sp.]|nr:Trp biosynthesis-associated membrane protein [Marmoricola sp.]